jgi:Fibronectin type III domain
MTSTNNRVSLGFTKLTDANAVPFSANLIVKLTGNAAFPNLPLTIAALTAQFTTYQNAVTAAVEGGKIAKVVRDAAREVLETSLRAIAAYVQSVAGQDLTVLLSSGFEAVNNSRTQTPLETPSFVKIEHGNTTQLFVSVTTIPNARSYEIQAKTATGNWQTVSVVPQSRNIVLDKLTPGAVYDLQVRAIGGSTGSSLWSAPVSQMAT